MKDTQQAAPIVPAMTHLPEWCKRNGVALTVAYKLIAEGHLPTIKVGRRRYVTPAGERQFVAAREAEARTSA